MLNLLDQYAIVDPQPKLAFFDSYYHHSRCRCQHRLPRKLSLYVLVFVLLQHLLNHVDDHVISLRAQRIYFPFRQSLFQSHDLYAFGLNHDLCLCFRLYLCGVYLQIHAYLLNHLYLNKIEIKFGQIFNPFQGFSRKLIFLVEVFIGTFLRILLIMDLL